MRVTRMISAGLLLLSLTTASPLSSQAAPDSSAVAQADWVQAVFRARGPFEPFGQRTLLGAEFHATLPNAPPGPYVIIQFRTAVPGGRTVTETIVPMRLPDASWRVSGYFVRPPS